jgi:hypothetical protein
MDEKLVLTTCILHNEGSVNETLMKPQGMYETSKVKIEDAGK